MSKISLIEISQTEKRSSTPSFRTDCFSFLAFVTEYVAKAEDVTDDIQKGKYGFQSRYTILYLYDIKNDPESILFLDEYGGKIHNGTSSNVSVLTYFTSFMIKRWKNIHYREKLEKEVDDNETDVMNTINALKNAYDIKSLPSMVVIKKDIDGNEESFNIDLSKHQKDEIYHKFMQVIDVINDNCEEDFITIEKKIDLSTTNITKANIMSDFNTYNYVEDLVKGQRKIIRNYNQQSLAAILGCTERTLRNKRAQNSFTRDECIIIGLEFSISVDELNVLLRANEKPDLSDNEKDEIIRRCLSSSLSLDKTNDELIKNGYKSLIPMKE